MLKKSDDENALSFLPRLAPSSVPELFLLHIILIPFLAQFCSPRGIPTQTGAFNGIDRRCVSGKNNVALVKGMSTHSRDVRFGLVEHFRRQI